MNRLSLLFLAFACCIGFALSDPPLPVLPPQFQVTIEANVLTQQTTYSQVEYYDFINQKARYEIETVTSSVVIVEDFKTGQAYNISNGNCNSKTPISSLTGDNIRSTNDLLMFGKEYNETYAGTSLVRGVPCDSWISQIVYTTNSTDTPIQRVQHQLTLQFFFTVESWGFREENVTRKPMRALLNGNRTYENGTVEVVTNYYEFVDFVAKAAPASLFTDPLVCGVPVPGLVTAWQIVTTTEGAGLVAGMFFLGLFIGIIIMAVIYAVKRRRERQRNFNQRMPMADRGDDGN